MHDTNGHSSDLCDLQHPRRHVCCRLEEEIREIKGKWEKAEAERIAFCYIRTFNFGDLLLLLVVHSGLKIALESGEIRSEMTATQRCLLLRHLTLEHSTDLNRLKHEVEQLVSIISSGSNAILYHSWLCWSPLCRRCRQITRNCL